MSVGGKKKIHKVDAGRVVFDVQVSVDFRPRERSCRAVELARECEVERGVGGRKFSEEEFARFQEWLTFGAKADQS